MSQMAKFDWNDLEHSSLPAVFWKDRIYCPKRWSTTEDFLAAAKLELKDMIDTYPSLNGMTYVVRESTHVANAVTEEATKAHTDLLFVGDSGKSAIGRFFLGSVSRYLLHHLPNSVWIARRKPTA